MPQPESARPVYTMRYRPATQFGTLPPGVHLTDWVRVPANLAHAFPNLPQSARPHGEFHTNRPLTPDELTRFEIDLVCPDS